MLEESGKEDLASERFTVLTRRRLPIGKFRHRVDLKVFREWTRRRVLLRRASEKSSLQVVCGQTSPLRDAALASGPVRFQVSRLFLFPARGRRGSGKSERDQREVRGNV